MKNLVEIKGNRIEAKEINGQRVVTFKDIDLVHQRPEGTASRSFRTNRKHFIEGEDYIPLTPGDFQSDEIRRFGITSPKGGFLITETGYLMLVKSFTDNLAWEVQRQLVKSYFRAKDEVERVPEQLQIEDEVQGYVKKTFRGETVVTVSDIALITAYSANSLIHHMKVGRVPYMKLDGKKLDEFKFGNPCIHESTASLIILDKGAVIALASKNIGLSKYRDKLLSLFDTEKKLEINPEMELRQSYAKITEAQILIQAMNSVADPYYKDHIGKYITALLIDRGLWDETFKGFDGVSPDFNINSLEGWNKISMLSSANILMRLNEPVTKENIKNMQKKLAK